MGFLRSESSEGCCIICYSHAYHGVCDKLQLFLWRPLCLLLALPLFTRRMSRIRVLLFQCRPTVLASSIAYFYMLSCIFLLTDPMVQSRERSLSSCSAIFL